MSDQHRKTGSKTVRAHIRDLQTGRSGIYEYEHAVFDNADDVCTLSGIRYMWAEGNYGCDCNRRMDLQRAHGEDPDEPECSAEKNRFVLDKLEVDGVDMVAL